MQVRFPRRLRLRAAAGLLAMLLATMVGLPALTVAAADGDLARGKRAFACHRESASLAPDQAVDGNSSTRFAAGGGCAHDTWFLLDLGDSYDLSAIHINWEAAHPSTYVLEASTDGQTYTELATVRNASAGWVKTAVSGTGRFLRIREVTRALSQYGFSIYDLEVYGRPAASKNDGTYRYVAVDPDIKHGSLSLSREGFVEAGASVTVTVKPPVGGRLAALTCNGTDVTDQVKDGVYTLTPSADTVLSATFAPPAADRYECEDATVLDKDGVTVIAGSIQSDAKASGGKITGNTGGKYFIFENVVEANCVQIAYASPNTNSMNLYIRYPWEADYREAGLIHFSTSNSWTMDSSYIAASSRIYIPEGSDLKIRPNVDCNLDCLWLTAEAVAKPTDAPANTVTADRLSDRAVEDVMATYGRSVMLTAGQIVRFTVPAGAEAYNVLSLSYTSEDGAELVVGQGSARIGDTRVAATPLRTYLSAGLRTATYAPGDMLDITCTQGSLTLDSVAVNYAPASEAVTVPALPAKGDRLTVSLDGIWSLGVQTLPAGEPPATLPAVDFINAIPVPGLWHSAAYACGDYATTHVWYQKTVTLPEAPSEQVLLYIEQAQYGRHIYVNGRYVDSYLYNYSHSYTDITDYLRKGENEIVIMLGNWVEQMNDPRTHVLYDGESTEDEPGITGSVSLIFNAAPEVKAVQTKADLDGAVEVQVTLQNRGDRAVVSDVTVTVYELGVFKNGKADRTEKKVGSVTLPGVQLNADGTVTVKTDAIRLDGWSRDKAWTPDSPFLYRVEIQTDGDTYTSRFGMRTFDFDPVTRRPRLNGEPFFMMGTNVAIERYYDDPLCGTTPWEEDWIRKLYAEFRDVNWNAFRVHLGNANEKWFDIADEMGMMIIDEYPQWGDRDGCVLDTFLPEIYAWMDLRGNHASLIMFDAQNEAVGDAFTDEIVRLGRAYDLQQRPWDNGWRAPIDKNDPIMGCHPYHIGGSGISGLANMPVKQPVLTLASIPLRYEDYKSHAFILEEHGEYWINREGAAMSATAGTWNSALPGATNEQRLTYYAELMAAQIEAYRAGRAYAGILFFCGLGSSFPSARGVTSDILSPEVATAETLQIRPYTKALLQNAFADLGISIGLYEEEVKRGEILKVPITLTNDTGKAVSDLPVTLKIMSGDTLLYAERITMSVAAFSDDGKGSATETLTVKVPAYRGYCDPGKTLVVTASYELNGETVFSQRKWTLERPGSFTDADLPVYDWLGDTETAVPGTEMPPAETQAPPAAESSAPETPAETAEPADDGCASSLLPHGLSPLLLAGAYSLLRRKRGA